MRITFTKRKKLILISFFITLLFFSSYYFNLAIWQKVVTGFFITYFLTIWILEFDIKKIKYIVFPIIPILFYLSMLLSYPILERLSMEYLVYPLLAGGMYLLLATLNILNIATIKTIPLSKAAWISLSIWRFIIAFLVFTFLFWFHFDWYLIILFIFIFSFLLNYPGFYFLIQQLGRGERSLYYLMVSTFSVAELGYLLIYWKVPFYGSGLILASFLYFISGLLEAHLQAKLSRNFFWEYGIVLLFSILLLFLL